VFCGKPQLQDAHLDTLLNPTVLVEVLSPSTEAYDRGRKFEHYCSIDSLQEYLLVASDRMHTDLYTRQADGRWIMTSAGQRQDKLVLTSIGCELTLADLYRQTELAEAASS
jgi:Uma2 family endonuclease